MGYKLLGFVVWQGGKLYIRGRFTGVAAKAALAGLGAAVLAGGAVAAARQASNRQQQP
jgi:hypothetical protein